MTPLLHTRSTLKFVLFSILFLIYNSLFAQSTQTLRGRVTDGVSKTPLIGVSIRMAGDGLATLGSTTDEHGDYRIDKVPLGRQTLIVSYIGYETQTLANILVTAGKEVVLDVSLQEAVSELTEIVVTSDSHSDKTATNNELALVSSRAFNTDETKRYAGALGDPSRMAANFAGVVGGNDGRNDIVVRGNSPTGMLWQMEGLNIPNPNHFGTLVSTGGPVSMLNANTLGKSDFMTSAFPAQYGNATAGVFDLALRNGNNEKTELMAQAGFNGFEVGAEGPFSKNSKGSYLVNYRYSTLGVFKALGIEFGTGTATPLYQDLNFKIALPSGKKGTFTVFGMGGASAIDLKGSDADLDNAKSLYGSENYDSYPRYKTGVIGVAYERTVSAKTFARLVAGISHTNEQFTNDSLVRDETQQVINKYLSNEGKFATTKYSANFQTRTKFNRRNTLVSGVMMDLSNVDLYQRDVFTNVGTDTVRLHVKDRTTLYQFHTTWRHRFNEHWSAQAGAHAQYYDLNKQWAVEPRLGLQFIPGDGKQSFSLGYGIHNQAQNITTSYVQTRVGDKSALTNLDLGFTTSHHFVFTYDRNITEHLRFKGEAYYQALSNVPVERNASSFASINSGISFGPTNTDSLVNKGVGKNYGVELTLERFFNQGYYFLVTTSLFNSRYEGSDGIERNTAYNVKHVLNVLGGKEWALPQGKFFSVNLKVTTIGGPYLTPLDLEESQARGRAVYRDSEAYSVRQKSYFRVDLRLSYRQEYKRSTLEASLDLQNLTNSQNIFSQTYNPRTNSVITIYQQPFFPVPYVRFTF
ncbi:TonB-dependent receptor [Chryseolinea lacunae]|uniref:TonB-dependent receptor n=1 Tax=Chryseolinea lacunae TaxID=2801331 RepID=A0ABS1L191_9BACT|nr:TonB-dependent receptor [Chryseolinea lacunae]MBL0745464.1 TonB-dependent receptor [Chryseolinea lacunae]